MKLGPTFSFIIKGQAVAPSLEFSFTKFSFGKCFIHCPGMNPPSQTLKITNKSKRDIRCLWHSLCECFTPFTLCDSSDSPAPFHAFIGTEKLKLWAIFTILVSNHSARSGHHLFFWYWYILQILSFFFLAHSCLYF